jgi:hypothetical protein
MRVTQASAFAMETGTRYMVFGVAIAQNITFAFKFTAVTARGRFETIQFGIFGLHGY